MTKTNKTTIQITKELREKLKKLGIKGESYEDIINRLILNDEVMKWNLKHTKEKNIFIC